MFIDVIQEGSTNVCFHGLTKWGVEPSDVSSSDGICFG